MPEPQPEEEEEHGEEEDSDCELVYCIFLWTPMDFLGDSYGFLMDF